jgi:hypothetical protein
MSVAMTERERYQRYLTSREWAEKRWAVMARSGGRCERCRINQADAVHHLTYIRKYQEQLDDLQAICEPCHEFTHGKSDHDPLAWLNDLRAGEPVAHFVYGLGRITKVDGDFPDLRVFVDFAPECKGQIERVFFARFAPLRLIRLTRDWKTEERTWAAVVALIQEAKRNGCDNIIDFIEAADDHEGNLTIRWGATPPRGYMNWAWDAWRSVGERGENVAHEFAKGSR